MPLNEAVVEKETRPAGQKDGKVPAGRTPVAVAGAGYIADYHLDVLSRMGSVEVVGAFDPNEARLDALCRRWNIPHRGRHLEELLEQCQPAVLHVLVPPPLHFDITTEALRAGLHVFLEKPMTLAAEEGRRLLALARERGLQLGVNHNAVFHPAFRRLLRDVSDRKLGKVQHLVSVANLPLGQLDSGQHDHWMFRAPANVLFEQAPHPLSQICALLGPVQRVQVMTSDRRTLRTGRPFHASWHLSLECAGGTAQLYLSFGGTFPEWRLQVIGQDGVADVDLINNIYLLDHRTKYLEPVDRCLRSVRRAGSLFRQGVGNFGRYALSTLRILGRRDPFYLSMRGSIEVFYRRLASSRPLEDSRPAAIALQEKVASIGHKPEALARGGHKPEALARGDGVPSLALRACVGDSHSIGKRSGDAGLPGQATWDSGENGLLVIEGLEQVVAQMKPESGAVASATVSAPAQAPREGDVLVLGGTGFIGRPLLRALAETRHSVRVLARSPALVPALAGGGPAVIAGDICNAEEVHKAAVGCKAVIHLVSGAPDNWEAFERLFIGGTRNVAAACLAEKIPQLLFVSSIAAYNLGSSRTVITEDTPLDTSRGRADYTRAKVACEQLLTAMHREQGLPVTIFRPGVVVGQGGLVEHSGIGYWPNPAHCISWARSIHHGLPFVLAQDVADALVRATGRDDLSGQSFNLVGDVLLSAEEYLEILRGITGREIHLHRQSALWGWSVDVFKWLVKAAARKPGNVFPSYRDLASRSLRSPFDCSRARRVLGWQPVVDRERFIDLGIRQPALGGES
jgi:predicted dehydrogenase/nucleoside-diphosphate-sugar epimerase